MKNTREIVITSIVTVVLVLVIALCISGTVLSQRKGGSIVEEQYYYTAEHEYVEAVRDLLEERGYTNSGVTMNYVIEQDGTREYTVLIHHRRIDQLDSRAKSELIEECQRIDFFVGECRFIPNLCLNAL